MKRTLGFLVTIAFSTASLAQLVAPTPTPKTIVILGDSLTEGYGLSEDEGYPALIQKDLQKKGKNVRVVNAGVSGATSAGAAERLKWHLKAKPSVIMIALGANDGLRGIDLETTKINLALAIDVAKREGAKVLLAGMKLPPNYGPERTTAFVRMYAELAREKKIPLIPFLLEGVGGEPALNLPDGIHPNAKGQSKVAETVLPFLEKLL